MPSYTKLPLSASLYGRGISVNQTGISGNLIHSTPTSTGTIDEVWLYASNAANNDTPLTIRFGSSGISGDVINNTVQAYGGAVLISPGFILQGDGSNSSNIYATIPSGYSGYVNIFGYVNRIA